MFPQNITIGFCFVCYIYTVFKSNTLTFMIPSDLKNKYPTLKDCTYLNTAYTGVVSSSLLEWRRATDQNYAVQVDQFKSNQAIALETNAQLQVARLMHTKVDQVFWLLVVPQDYKLFYLKSPKTIDSYFSKMIILP